jgi:hypothetical protein
MAYCSQMMRSTHLHPTQIRTWRPITGVGADTKAVRQGRKGMGPDRGTNPQRRQRTVANLLTVWSEDLERNGARSLPPVTPRP